VGWGWVVVLRDLSAATARAIDRALGNDPTASELALASEALTVVAFGPLLSFLLIRTNDPSFTAFCVGWLQRSGWACGCRPRASEPAATLHAIDREPPLLNGMPPGDVESGGEGATGEGAAAACHCSGVHSAGGGGGSVPAARVYECRAAFEGGGARSIALGRRLRNHRRNLGRLARCQEAATSAVAQAARTAAVPASAGQPSMRAHLCDCGHADASSLPSSVRATTRGELLASLLAADPVLAANSKSGGARRRTM